MDTAPERSPRGRRAREILCHRGASPSRFRANAWHQRTNKRFHISLFRDRGMLPSRGLRQPLCGPALVAVWQLSPIGLQTMYG